ncbi:hypothetical protein MKW92_005210 [Papaver armeniacum]|nr:hypothetical protein MKW92_005210 [Papaver armeniacum]
MGVLFNGAQRSDLKPGDHIYTWRVVYAYSHHGIYMGGDKVVHFTQERDESSGFGASLNTSASSSSIPSNLKLPTPSASASNFSANLKLPNPSASTSNFSENLKLPNPSGLASNFPSNLNLPNPSASTSNFSANLKLPNPSGSTSKFPSNLNSSDSSGLGSNSGSFNSFGSGSNLASTCSNFPDCGFKNPNSGVVLSCLDCFLGSGSLYLFEYEVTPSIFFAKVRGGTCTTAKSDPTDMVIHRAMYLLQKGFGNYDIFLNNCEDFALYCKTGLLTLDKSGVGRSGQAASVVGAPLAAILATPLRFLMPAPVGMAVTAGMYCVSRYATDIGVRSDVIKVAVEDMSVDLGWVRNPGKEAAEEDEEVSKREMPNHGLGSSSNPKRKKSS